MNDPLEQQTVVDFVLEDEKHLDAAARMAKDFPEAKRRVVGAMLDELERKLSEFLGAKWDIYNCRDDVFVRPYAGFRVWGELWDDYYLNLENNTREGKTLVGIWREKKPNGMALDDALAEAFAKKGIIGKRQRWWAWFKVLPSEYGNWNDVPALSAMCFRRKEVVELIASEMLSIHRIAKPLVERFVSHK